jgi:hypothetical protein
MAADPGPRMDETIHQLHRIKRYRRYFKYMAVTCIIMGLGVMFLWPYFEQIPLLFLNQKWALHGRLEIGKIDLKKKFIEHPKFIGGGDRPYTLMADRAQQVEEDKVVLENVQARITLKSGAILSVLSQGGDVQIKNQKHAHLYGNVNIIYEKGDTEVWTDSIFVDLKQGFLETSDRVEGVSLYGALQGSQGIYIHQDKQLYKLKGPSDLMINRLEKERL